MTRHLRLQAALKFALPLFVTTFAASLSLAQPPGGPPPQDGPDRPPFGGPPPGRPGMPPFGGPRQASVVDMPISMLRAGLDLSAEQTAKIASIQEQFQRQRQTQFRRPGAAGGPQGRAGGQGAEQGGPGRPGGPDGPDGRPGGPGGPPPGGPGGPAMNGMSNQNKQAGDRIMAVLTATQKQALPGLLKELDTLRGAGIPAETYGDLKLTADQKTRLAAVARKSQQQMRQDMDKARQGNDFAAMRDTMQQSRQKTREQVMSILTAEQHKVLEQFRKDHPRPQGRDGFGPPPGGRPGGPPRPEGQDDGPPPPPPPGGEADGPEMPLHDAPQ
jgi:Spy/CpxP family protein refolding chaperone